MALSVPSGAANRLGSADDATWAPGSTGTIFLKIKPNWNAGDSVTHVFYSCGFQDGTTANWRVFRMEKFTDNNVYMGFFDGVGGTLHDYRVTLADTGLFTSGTWANHILTWDSSAPASKYYVGNSLKGSTSTLTVSDWTSQSGDREDFGNDFILPGGYGTANVADASLAEFARWNRVLDDTERAILQAGFSPLFLPRGLLEYRPFINGSTSRLTVAEGPDVTVNASGTSWVTHPSVLYPASPLGRWLHTAAAATSTAGFRSFNAFLFLPNAGAGGAVVTPTVTSGRKLISPAMAKTLTAELT